MARQSVQARLVYRAFPNGEFTERDEFEAASRGVLSHVLVGINGKLFPVVFYDPVRLQQDLEEETKQGRGYIAYPAMIVVNEVRRENMEAAAQRLSEEGFFEHLRPVTEEELASADPYHWPP